MPKSIGQWTGLVITTIVVLGRDWDIVYALPMGVTAGALAAFFVAQAEARYPALAYSKSKSDK
jgi:hypothetical protein